jgi:hypothetical protein
MSGTSDLHHRLAERTHWFMRSLLRSTYRLWRRRRWWIRQYRAWRAGATLSVGPGSVILAPSVLIELSPGAILRIGAHDALRRFTTTVPANASRSAMTH